MYSYYSPHCSGPDAHDVDNNDDWVDELAKHGRFAFVVLGIRHRLRGSGLAQ